MSAQDHLDRFYVELQAWIDGGCQAPSKFSRAYGLCGNLDGWCAHEDDDAIVFEELSDAMCISFDEAELSDIYPFNSRGDSDYKRERTAGAIYTNPARLAWIKEHAEAALARRAGGEVAA